VCWNFGYGEDSSYQETTTFSWPPFCPTKYLKKFLLRWWDRIYQKPRSRDFIDLYLIIKGRNWTFSDLRQKARAKFDIPIDPLQMAQQLFEAEKVKDYPRMLVKLDPQTWINFWKEEALTLKGEALV